MTGWGAFHTPQASPVMKATLRARAADYRKRAGTAAREAQAVVSEELKRSHRGLAHGWINLAEARRGRVWRSEASQPEYPRPRGVARPERA